MTVAVVREVPRTRLRGDAARGFVVYLQCKCGAELLYPGHPRTKREVECDYCRTIWKETP